MPKPRYHTALSLGLAALMVARTRRWRSAVPILIAGVLVDIDHVVDLLANRQGADIRWSILPLHAWEWVLTLLTRRTPLADGLAGGLAAHLALDQMNHAVTHPLFYWITLRALHGFRARPPLINPERYARGSRWMARGPTDWF
ncbi:MAG: hypothetical protein JO352_19935 [Chloroflexi bacterium]|nr:hypothetical protein [Chloroflexota bacterium]MBV9598143.1 hypothetical protein [Chloroflexota bacterium]